MGNLGVAQDLINVLEAIKINKSFGGFEVHFVGDGSVLDKMKEYVINNEMDNLVFFHGRHHVQEMPLFYKEADVCILSLRADSEIGLTLPTKIQGYMAAGKPILGMINGSAQNVIKDSLCGICVESGDIIGFASAMREIINNKDSLKMYGNNSRNYFIKHFRKKVVLDKIEDAINQCVSNK